MSLKLTAVPQNSELAPHIAGINQTTHRNSNTELGRVKGGGGGGAELLKLASVAANYKT